MEPSTSSSVRTSKRKLEDAIRTLDDVVVSPSSREVSMPSKRPYLTRSVYSTLSKFGAVSKEQLQPSSSIVDVSKSAPHLAAILARSTSHSKEAPSSPLFVRPAHPASEYRPSSTDSFLYRLATYKITTYANKPPQIDAVSAVRCGWMNDGKDRLICGICGTAWVLAGQEGMNKDAANALIEKQRMSLVEMHKNGCPWKARQCAPSVYRVPLQAPTVMVRQLIITALSLEPMLARVAIKHPLTLLELTSLRSVFSAATSEKSTSEHDSAMDIDETAFPVVPSDTAILVSLFGWVPAPDVSNELRSSSPLSISRTRSYGPSVSAPPIPSLSRTGSISVHFQEHVNPPVSVALPQVSISQFKAIPRQTSSRARNPDAVARDGSLVYCTLCLRRVGLWAYLRNETSTSSTQGEDAVVVPRGPQKEFDLVKEHRSYCPYIVCSSTVPSFLHSPEMESIGKVTEGWRAMLAVVQRYELSKRQRLSRFLPSDDPDKQASSVDLQRVESMVAGIKTNGGQELLRYVKGLLG